MSVPRSDRSAVTGREASDAHGVVAHGPGNPPAASGRNAHLQRRRPPISRPKRATPNTWITSITILGRHGALTASELARICPGIGHRRQGGGGGPVEAPPGVRAAMEHCVARVGAAYHEVVTYQPGNRYWPLQWYELAIFLAAALALAGVCLWRIRRIGRR